MNDPIERLFWFGVIAGFVWGYILARITSYYKYKAEAKARLERARLSRGLTQWR